MRPNKYKRVVSIGVGCGPATMLQHYGLRDASYPFDWLTTPIEAVVEQLDSGFSQFLLDTKTLSRREDHPRCILDSASRIGIQHDFTADGSLEEELPAVREKYLRRFKRLAEGPGPILFIRYINTEQEQAYLDTSLDELLAALRKTNPENDLLIIKQSLPSHQRSGPDMVTVRDGVELYLIDWQPAIQLEVPSLKENRALHKKMIGLRYPISLRLHNLYHHNSKRVRNKMRRIDLVRSGRELLARMKDWAKRSTRPLASRLIGEDRLQSLLKRTRSQKL